MVKRSVILFVLFFQIIFGFASFNIDSLNGALKKLRKEDTLRVNTLIEISRYYFDSENYSSGIEYADEAYKLAIKIKHYRGEARSAHILGILHKESGNYETSLNYHKKALAVRKKQNFKNGMADSYNSLGDIYNNQGNYKDALENFIKALDIYSELKNKGGMAWAHCNMGVVLANQNDLDGAMENYEKAIMLAEEIKDYPAMAWYYNNLGNGHVNKKEYDKALDCFNKALDLQKKSEVGAKNIAYTYNNIGTIYFEEGKYDLSLEYFEQSLQLRKETNDRNGISWSLADIGEVYVKKKNFGEAIKLFKESLVIALEMGQPERIRESYESLSESYYLMKDYKNAYEFHVLFTTIKDSLLNAELQSQIEEMKSRFEAEKKDKEIIGLKKEKKLSDLEIENRRMESENHKMESENHEFQRNFFIAGSIALVLIALFIFSRFRSSQKQKKLIELHKVIVEEKNKEIVDSINYAKRLQDAILPPMKLVKKFLPESFILYRPKDIVAGDFYFFEPVGKKIVIAAADCTGHGVPGAMVSVVCANALNRTVKEFGIISAEKILDKVREIVVDTFSRSESEVKDGMDISLCVLDTETNELSWAGANNPLWLIRNSLLSNGEVSGFEEFNPDKQPVGVTFDPAPFTNHQVKLLKGDTFYLFTDGYQDQFGGEKGKKFKTANMKKLIFSLQNNSMELQGEMMNNEFEKWRGNLEQLDDVCLIGIRIK